MQSTPSILIIEDEQAIRDGLTDVLIYHGFHVEYAEDGLVGLEIALSGNFDLILLDVMLPSINGFDICKKIREQDLKQAIIMLTAKSSDEDIINGFQLGADDYVAKPFSITQLVLRIKAVLKRSMPEASRANMIVLDERTKIDLQNLCVERLDTKHLFTKREVKVLTYLHEHNDKPVSREDLLSAVWGYSEELAIETRTVDIHIARIRKKIEADAKAPKFLVTVRGAGYRLLSTTENA
jgi:two-component system response regulator RegX3